MEASGAFEAVAGRAAGHPLLAHAARRRRALPLSELVEPGALSHRELFGDLRHGSGVEYQIARLANRSRRDGLSRGSGA